MFGLKNLIRDPAGDKPSSMRIASLFAVIGGVAILIGGAFGYADVEVTASDALWIIGLGLAGKAAQRGAEAEIEKARMDGEKK